MAKQRPHYCQTPLPRRATLRCPVAACLPSTFTSLLHANHLLHTSHTHTGLPFLYYATSAQPYPTYLPPPTCCPVAVPASCLLACPSTGTPAALTLPATRLHFATSFCACCPHLPVLLPLASPPYPSFPGPYHLPSTHPHLPTSTFYLPWRGNYNPLWTTLAYCSLALHALCHAPRSTLPAVAALPCLLATACDIRLPPVTA